MDSQSRTPTLDRVAGPMDLKALSDSELAVLADELRHETIETVSRQLTDLKRIGIIALPGRRMVEIRDRAALLDCSEAA